uniref:Uncharacterized protein n=1 Tax=Anguilla anguilla TaxID=7936 RepID=A0A0E9VVN6_ANGAN
MYLSKEGMSFLRMLHSAPISSTSRAKISCRFVSLVPVVGKN